MVLNWLWFFKNRHSQTTPTRSPVGECVQPKQLSKAPFDTAKTGRVKTPVLVSSGFFIAYRNKIPTPYIRTKSRWFLVKPLARFHGNFARQRKAGPIGGELIFSPNPYGKSEMEPRNLKKNESAPSQGSPPLPSKGSRGVTSRGTTGQSAFMPEMQNLAAN
jgi:hypothetical protein